MDCVYLLVLCVFIASVLAYVVCIGLLKSALANHGADELQKFGLDTASQLSLKSARRNQLKAQAFVLSGFKRHNDPIVVKRGWYTYWTMISAFLSLVVLVVFMLLGEARI